MPTTTDFRVSGTLRLILFENHQTQFASLRAAEIVQPKEYGRVEWESLPQMVLPKLYQAELVRVKAK